MRQRRRGCPNRWWIGRQGFGHGALCPSYKGVTRFFIALYRLPQGTVYFFPPARTPRPPPPSCGKKVNCPRHTPLLCHAAFPPWRFERSREAGRLAEPSETKYVARLLRPAGDFCPRPFRCAGPAVTMLQPLRARRHRGEWLFTIAFAGPACVLLQHAGTVVSRGEPLDGASPAPWLRRPWNGGADPSPLSNDSGAFPAGRTLRLCARGRMCEQKAGRRFFASAFMPLIRNSSFCERVEMEVDSIHV
jgi:hypothetical protein